MAEANSQSVYRPWRVSLRTALVLTALWAASLAVWRYLTYESLVDRTPSYERAPRTQLSTMMLGPNRVHIERVTRNRRDGSLSASDGGGREVGETAAPDSAALSRCAAWLDVVQIELEEAADLPDIVELRVFDHAQRKLLAEVDAAYGYRFLEPDRVQVYGFQRELPETIDVWFRVNGHYPDEAPLHLDAQPGALCATPHGTIAVGELRGGDWAYDSRKAPAYHLLLSDNDQEISVSFQLQGGRDAADYAISAVTHDGRRVPDARFLRLTSSANYAEPRQFAVGLAELDHFEVRRWVGRQPFFFEGVRLPAASGQPFLPPPTVSLAVEGKLPERRLSGFAPLQVSIAVEQGDLDYNISSKNSAVIVTQSQTSRPSAKDAFTVRTKVHGLSGLLVKQRFQQRSTGEWVDPAKTFKRLGSTGYGLSGLRTLAVESYGTPLEDVAAIEASLELKK
ncbi:MAG: hypothetical protein KDA61_17840 [Planctomycetales bacterium]|nr:hypothetical protein [Planctomycetales bacterium]